MGKNILLFALVILLLPIVQAADPDNILVNSQNWQDVYSVMLFGTLTGENTAFLVSNRHATLILNSIPKTSHLWLINSVDYPFILGFLSYVESQGYSAEERKYGNINLDLAEELTDVSNFVVLDGSYGYNAVSVAPYAVSRHSYVLFADRDNIGDIVDYLDAREVNEILIYGHVDREVMSELSGYGPEILNMDGDRFMNNIELLKRYAAKSEQVILTNGEFIEKEIMLGKEPVVFIGTNNVPTVVRDYIQGSEIDVGVLIGNELVGTATTIRRQLGISVFVKFAQGARAPEGAISQVEALDMFYMPVYTLNLLVESVVYNRGTSKLEVTLRNTEDLAAYFLGTYTIQTPDGARITVGDSEPNFIDGQEIKTMIYDVEIATEGDMSADVFVIYGESKYSLEKEIRETYKVESVRILDECTLQINEVVYKKGKPYFYLQVQNNIDKVCYADIELVDITVAGERGTYGLDSILTLGPQSTKDVRILVEDFEDDDLMDNEEVRVRAYYGERKNSLVNVMEATFKVTVQAVDLVFYSLLALIAVLVALILRKRYKGQAKPGK
ncbi:MAG: hypothetical protein ABH879_07870 [archaeon]